MDLKSHSGGAQTLMALDPPEHTVALAWLGQSGFLIRHRELGLLIDPYLSNRLERKHAGTDFSHERMMPSPVEPAQFQKLDAVFCTHRHGDHMDPDTLTVLAKNNPQCRFVIPRAEIKLAMESGLAESRILPITDGETVRISHMLEFQAIASAHETLQVNKNGDHHFLGYVLRFGQTSLYHSGDCVVYEGLGEHLRKLGISVALLPVNGRSEHLRNHGIVGNMNFQEATELCLHAGIHWMLPTHFEMFAFNTVPRDELRRNIATIPPSRLHCVLPEVDSYYTLS
jgi:L-ascorbate metabolism protein UlaG (beta-lactamase superfamily)